MTAILMAVTGLLITHSATLGLGFEGPPLERGNGTIAEAAPINDLLKSALREAVTRDIRLYNRIGRSRPASGPSAIDRAVFRPDTRTAQVRLRDARATEIVVDWSTGAVLKVSARDDIRLRHVHAASILGQRGVIVTDIAAVVLIALVVTGLMLWIARTRDAAKAVGGFSRWWDFNWWFHRVGGLTVSLYLVVVGVTGVMLNHKHHWGLMVEPIRELEAEYVSRLSPSRLPVMVRTAVQALVRRDPSVTAEDVALVDYRPLRGYAKVRFRKADMEVVVNAYDGEILSIARRYDLLIEKIHTGLLFGGYGFLLSDIVGVLLILLTINGLYLWVRPAWIGRGRPESEETMV